MLKIENLVATAIALGIPLIKADEKVIEWNKQRQMLQIVAL